MKAYPEITELELFIETYNASVCTSEKERIKCSLIPIELILNKLSLTVYIDDEFNDIELNNRNLIVALALRELALIDDSDDFLQWMSWCGEDSSNMELLEYYKTICSRLHTIKRFFQGGEIDYFISDLDIQLNSGAVKQLRTNTV